MSSWPKETPNEWLRRRIASVLGARSSVHLSHLLILRFLKRLPRGFVGAICDRPRDNRPRDSGRSQIAPTLLSVLVFLGYAAVVLPAGSNEPSKQKFGFGRAATATEVTAWDIDVRPDGQGLPKGKGSVAEGQKVYEQHCESCHGAFGENNDWMMIAGGVTKSDFEKGRASALMTDTTRTVGTKLNFATTLWDYINRAMPMMNPKTLTADEVYAVTAYVLHLNDIVPSSAALDQDSLPKVKMPNRNGFTREHGMGSERGNGDVQGATCVVNCANEVKITSELPSHARNAHGNLAEQGRTLGPYAMADTRSDTQKSAPSEISAVPTPEALAAQHTCTACHQAAARVVGPSWAEIATKYKGDSAAAKMLAERVRKGNSGVWGTIPMPANAKISDTELDRVIAWVLAR